MLDNSTVQPMQQTQMEKEIKEIIDNINPPNEIKQQVKQIKHNFIMPQTDQ